ncbi:MAG TPA: SURF1 family protein [Acidimicrobiales bacterium]|nr:SURF1 family protein [Acidimicrobiales bacterium]
MFRFALRPRWLLAHVVVLAIVIVLVNLGFWQLRRLDERRAANAEVLRGTRETLPLEQVLHPDDVAVGSARYQRVQVRGTFDESSELLVRFRTHEGLPGYDVVTPLAVEDGGAVLVARGWVPLELGDTWRERGTLPPSGTVTVTGLVREAEDPSRFRPVREDGRLVVGAVATARLEAELGRDLYPGWVQLVEPDDPSSFPEPLPEPDFGEGPHLSYAVQWFSFAAIAVIGWVFLVRAAGRGGARAGRSAPPPPSTGS